MTRVLPEPAPASTSTGPCRVVTASRCGGLSSSRRRTGTARNLPSGGGKRKLEPPNRSCLGYLWRMDPEARYAALLSEAEARGVRLRKKAEVWHQRVIDRVLRLITLGAQSSYLDQYVTTFGRSIYVTP